MYAGIETASVITSIAALTRLGFIFRRGQQISKIAFNP